MLGATLSDPSHENAEAIYPGQPREPSTDKPSASYGKSWPPVIGRHNGPLPLWVVLTDRYGGPRQNIKDRRQDNQAASLQTGDQLYRMAIP